MKKIIILLSLLIFVFFDSYSQVKGIPLEMNILSSDIELFESKLTPSAKKMYDEIISTYVGDIQPFEIEIFNSFYDFTVGLGTKKFLFIKKEKRGTSPEKTEVKEYRVTPETKYKKITVVYFTNEENEYDSLEFFLFPN